MEGKFTQYIEEKFPSDGKRRTSGIIHTPYAEKIKQYIKNPDTPFSNIISLLHEKENLNFRAAISRSLRILLHAYSPFKQ